jgi:hypothetical protein
MSHEPQLTERQRFWLEHLRACGSGPLKSYAEAHGLDLRALYDAKARLKRKGILSQPPSPRLVRAERAREEIASSGYCRVHLRNGTAVDVACTPGHWAQLLASVAELP